MERVSSLVMAGVLALTLAQGARAEDAPAAVPAKAPERVTEPCGEGGPELTPVERAEKERQKHSARLTKLDQLEQVGKDSANQALLASVARMRDKENARHERVLARLESMQVQRDQKLEQRQERREEKAERRKDRREARAEKRAKGKAANDQAAPASP